MNPQDINRLNYNCFYIGSQLDTLVRSKMKSESFITPLKVTPKFYEDELSKKMKLLGQHGTYYPEEISPYNEEYNRQLGDQNLSIPNHQSQQIPPQQSSYHDAYRIPQPIPQQHHIPQQQHTPQQMPYQQTQRVQQEAPQQMPYQQNQRVPQEVHQQMPYQQSQQYLTNQREDYDMRPSQNLQIEKTNNIQCDNQNNISHIQKYQHQIQQPHNEQPYRSELPRNRYDFNYINKY